MNNSILQQVKRDDSDYIECFLEPDTGECGMTHKGLRDACDCKNEDLQKYVYYHSVVRPLEKYYKRPQAFNQIFDSSRYDLNFCLETIIYFAINMRSDCATEWLGVFAVKGIKQSILAMFEEN